MLRLFRRIGQKPTQALIIEQQPHTDRYVQLLIGHGMAHAEASSNVYLGGDSRLSVAQEDLLERVGWSRPARDADDPDELPANWTLPLVTGSCEDLVEVIVATVAGVFQFDENLPVEVRTFMVMHPCKEHFPTVPR
jgi:hypothetical protein